MIIFIVFRLPPVGSNRRPHMVAYGRHQVLSQPHLSQHLQWAFDIFSQFDHDLSTLQF